MENKKHGKVFSMDGTRELKDYEIDLQLGYLETYTEVFVHPEVKEKPEKGHYEITNVYANGGQDVEWIIDQEKQEKIPAWEETVVYYKYIPFAEEEIQKTYNLRQIEEVKQILQQSDFKVLKYLEGWYTEEEFQKIKDEREEYRQFIRRLEKDNEQLDKIIERKK